MTISSSTDGGFPVCCDVCGTSSLVHVSRPPGDSVCPTCGSFLWVHAVSEITSRHHFVPDLCLRQVSGSTRDGVLRQIIEAMAAEWGWTEDHVQELIAAIEKREQLGSTGIGRGMAVPHTSVDWVDSCTTAMAFVPGGVAFDSPDGEPVHTLIMLVSPSSKPGDHLRKLEQISRALRYLRQSAE